MFVSVCGHVDFHKTFLQSFFRFKVKMEFEDFLKLTLETHEVSGVFYLECINLWKMYLDKMKMA